ncbi:DUF4145 domain-containing protein [Acinetobacter sp. ANC 4635]|uniref:DUF4145 domain-containing protein n=1 Tax=Acinetobacter sp. ANC 4635 TaxID=2529846 RepID=UPI00103A3880|nr:DUF4145 domain-containing protein [Acinetobacter sp. ANC 4635]TCB31946.1 DUF4145 domain-containing protein [Acinetobacter sp. ANC 4635]
MEIWKICWSCNHDTPQKRIYLKVFPRPVEGFFKDKLSEKATSFWSLAIEIYQFCECKKCGAPILHIDEYLHPQGLKLNTEEIFEIFNSISTEVKNKGYSDEYKRKSLSFPNFNNNSLKNKKWSFNLPEDDMLLFFEVITAWDKGLYILSLSGIRTLIDRYMVKLVGDIGGFKTKLKKMLEENHINKKQYELLDIVIEAGNAAGHRGFKPDKDMLDNLLHVVEDIISLEYKTMDFSHYSEIIPQRNKSE